MSITIQLNGDALNKLIDLCGGNEFVLQLRKGVMENVLGVRIKALSKDIIDAATEGQIKASVTREIGEIKKNYAGRIESIKLVPDLLDYITSAVNEAVSTERTRIRQAIEDAARTVASKINEDIADRLESSINAKVDRLTETYIKEKVAERFKQALGSLNA